MNTKINIKKGYKRELIEIMYISGLIPYKSLRILEGPTNMYQRSVHTLVEEGLIKIEKKKGIDRCLRFTDAEKMHNQVEGIISPEDIEYYKQVVGPTSWNINGSPDKRVKAVKDSSTMIFMYACGIPLGAYKKNIAEEMIESSDKMYYSSLEIKKVQSYKLRAEGKGDAKKHNNTRINGVLISAGGIYGVYNLGDKIIEWKRQGEVAIGIYITELMRQRSVENLPAKIPRECIIMSRNWKTYEQICTQSYDTKRETKHTFINVDYAYDRMYAVPEDENGKLLIQIMTQEKWREKILRLIVSEDKIENRKSTGVPCDAYELDADANVLIFCIPDLVKLKMFTARANLECSKKRFKIYCFSFQAPLVLALGGRNVDVYQMGIKDFIKQYIDSG